MTSENKLSKLLNFLFPVLLIGTSVFICFKNYTPGTFLLGWDSLHPEFNFSEAFKRAFGGVWREEQGVGAIAAHSHMADLPRIFILWLFSFVLPLNFLRYFYIFFCLVFGPLGVYFLLKNVLAVKEKSSFWPLPAAFLAGLFYLLNLVTLQHFLAPFEMFNVQYAFLPWLFLLIINYLKRGKKKDLVFFSILTVLSSPMAYASALYWAFFGGFCLFLGFYWLVSKNKRLNLKKVLILVFLEIILNLYWVVPNVYSALNQSETISSSKINLLFSPEAFLRNSEYGNITDIALGKNFLFEWRVFDFDKNEFVDLMADWNNFLAMPGVKEIGYLMFAFACGGVIFSLVKRDRIGLSFLPVLLFSLFFLLNNNPPLGNFYSSLLNRFGFLKEGFRMPFTKFSLIYQLVIAFYFGYFFFELFSIFSKVRVLTAFKIFLMILVSGGLIYFCLPFFKGELISRVVRIKLPDEYFRLFDWFEGKEGRIAKLPIFTLWGWEYHDWSLPSSRQGYQGSGFLPFGLEEPTLDRDFDRWSVYNETFYNEASTALYRYQLPDDKTTCQTKKECSELEKINEGIRKANQKVTDEFLNILKKYQVKYLLLDESVINAGGGDKILFIPEIKDLIAGSDGRILESVKFGEPGRGLTVYEIKDEDAAFVRAPAEFIQAKADTIYSKSDPIFQKYGDYITEEDRNLNLGDGDLQEAISFPFVNFDSRGPVKIETVGNQLLITNKKENAKVIFPIEEKIEEEFGQGQGFETGYNCDLKKKGEAVKKRLGKGNFYGAYEGGVSCDWFDYSSLAKNKAYILQIKGENLKGRSLKIYLQNLQTGRMDLEELLPSGKFNQYYLIFPSESEREDSLNLAQVENEGYTLNVETRSFGRIASENIIESITFIPIDINFLTGLSTTGEEPERIENSLKVAEVKKMGKAIYQVMVKNSVENKKGLLMLGQGYERGWKAFPVRKFQILNSRFQIQIPDFQNPLKHLKVNGWANGWIVPAVGSPSSTIFIVFWPQFLEWGGIILAFLAFLAVIFL